MSLTQLGEGDAAALAPQASCVSRVAPAAVLGLALGAFAFVETQSVTAPWQDSPIKLCTAGNETALQEALDDGRLHPYVGALGGPFVCILTQFMLALSTEPAGILVWGFTACTFTSIGILVYAEAGRYGARGLVKWPIPIFVLAQIFGISVIFPIMWLPAAMYGSGTGAPSTERVKVAMLLQLPTMLLQAGVFCLDQSSFSWTFCAGMLGGPLIGFVPMFAWPFPAPVEDLKAPAMQATALLQKAYVGFGSLGLVMYWGLICHACLRFDSASAVLAALWGPQADPSVAFMTVDGCVLCLTLMLYLALSGPPLQALQALAAVPFVGPGAAAAAVLYTREVERFRNLGEMEDKGGAYVQLG